MVANDGSSGGRGREPEAVGLLKAVLETVVDGILTIDSSGTVITANPAAERIFGYTQGELIGKNVKMLMPSPYHEEHDQYLSNYRETGVRKIIGIGREAHGRRKDGTVFPIYLGIGETTTDEGPIFTGIVRDISERRKAEEALRNERSLLKAVVETAVDGIITIDELGTIVTANPATSKIFGYEQDELIGKNVKLLMPSPYHEEHDGYLANYRESGVRKIIGIGREVEGKRKNGEIFPLELAVSETETEGGRVFTGIVRDVTERKRVQDAIVAKEAAEKANEAKNEFLSRMSHELRTPLNAVLGFAQLLEMRFDDPKVIEATQAIIKGGNHLLMLINEILDLARIESGTLTVSVESVEISDVISHVADLVEPLAAKAGVSVFVTTASFQDVYVRADSRRLLQALLNVVSNAIKYNHKGGSVKIVGRETDKETFQIDVVDTGQGIPEEHHAELFQPFRRFGDLNIEGSGLGLVVSKSFIDMMEGSIELAHSSLEGTTFTVTLKKAQARPKRNGKELADELGAKPVLSGKPIVLYIEDNLPNFRLLELAFQEWGDIQLEYAKNGKEGLESAFALKPDLVLLDLHLPDIPGYDVLNTLKSKTETVDIPVVVISADAMTRQIRRLIEAGAHDYVTKPIDLHKLGGIVRSILEGRG